MTKKMLLYARFPFHLRTIKKISGAQRLSRWVDFAYEGCSGLIRPFQIRAEIFQLLKSLEKLTPKVVLEIGTAIGGNLFLFCRMAAEDACIISIDLPGGRYGEGYPLWRAPLYKMFPAKNQKLHLIRADSHKVSTLQEVKRILNDQKIDFLFIDGDHTYEGVKQDFEMYQPLVKNGGLIAFHDVVPHPEHYQCGVDRFWHEIKPRYDGEEIVNYCKQQWAGIGVIRNEIFSKAPGCRALGMGGCGQ
ncbi:MAG: class I SAM-dependent methyltransferase [Desulfobacterales bacterium]|nr:MAG: class I SAM-dependent methyltransferase [Desulfobacterales bacterium]